MTQLKERKYLLGIWLRTLRHKHGLTQVEFASKIGLTVDDYHPIELGLCRPAKLKTFELISKNFDVEMDVLMLGLQTY